MPFSIRCGLTLLCLTMLPLLHAQVIPKVYQPTGGIPIPGPSCCVTTSKSTFNEPVTSCFEQRENIFPGCKVHAYIFCTESKRALCVDPGAWWIPQRLKRLEQRGIHCQIL